MAEERVAQTVVTGDTILAFQEERLGLNTEPEEVVETVEEPVVESDADEVEEHEEEPQESDPQDEHKAKVKNRFVKLREQRNQARELAAQEAAKRTEYEAKIRELEEKLSPKIDPAKDEKPDPNKYTDLDTFTNDLEKWKERQVKQQIEREAKEKVEREQAETIAKSWQQRLTEVKKEFDDFDDVVTNSTVQVSDQVRQAILESDVGPRILYHLADNPDVAEKIGKMTVIGALREIGRLEERLQTKQTKPAPIKTVEVSKAPPPINPIRGESVATDEGDGENLSIHRYKELRKAGKIR